MPLIETKLVDLPADVRQKVEADIQRLRLEPIKLLMMIPLYFVILLPIIWFQNPSLQQSSLSLVVIILGTIVALVTAVFWLSEKRKIRAQISLMQDDLSKNKLELVSYTATEAVIVERPLGTFLNIGNNKVLFFSDESAPIQLNAIQNGHTSTSGSMPNSQFTVIRFPVSGRIIDVRCNGAILPYTKIENVGILPASGTLLEGNLQTIEKTVSRSREAWSLKTWGCAILAGGLFILIAGSFVAMKTIHGYQAVRLQYVGNTTRGTVFISGVRVLDSGTECQYEFFLNSQRFIGTGPDDLQQGQSLPVIYDPLNPKTNRPVNGLIADIIIGVFVWLVIFAITGGIVYEKINRRRSSDDTRLNS